MVFQRRRSATLSTISNDKTTVTASRIIDGSKDTRSLLQDHLEGYWCSSSINTITDRRGRLSGFISGDFFLEFAFETSDTFSITTCVFSSTEDGVTKHIDQISEIQKNLDSRQIEIKVTKKGAVYIKQEVSVASLLTDEDAEDTIEYFFTASRSLRNMLKGKKKSRRRSWFMGRMNSE